VFARGSPGTLLDSGQEVTLVPLTPITAGTRYWAVMDIVPPPSEDQVPRNASEMSGFRWGWGRCVVVTVGERPGSPVCVVLRGLEGTEIGAGAVHEARLGGTFPLTAACLTVLM